MITILMESTCEYAGFNCVCVSNTNNSLRDSTHCSCWLSVEKNVIWSFIVPVIVIILV